MDMAIKPELFQVDPVAVEPPRLQRYQLIEAIMEFNSSALREYYLSFEEGELQRYLDHLRCEQAPRDRTSRWSRDKYAPAVVKRENDD